MKIRLIIPVILCAAFTALGAEEYYAATNLWKALIGPACVSSPALGHDGAVYVGSWQGHLFAFNPDGSKRWRFKTGFEMASSPAVGTYDTVYIGCRDRNFYAVDKKGRKKWMFKTDGWVDTSAAIGQDGALYFGSWDKKFYAVNPDGSKKWEFVTRGPVLSSAAIDAGGVIYFGSNDRKFYALNPDGAKRWEYAAGGAVISSPAIGDDGALYFTSLDGKLHALNPDGTQRWELQTGGITPASPSLAVDGTIYLLVNTNCCAVSPEGKFKWKENIWTHPEEEWSATAPAVLSTGVALFTSGDGLVMAHRPEGKWYWNFWLNGPSRSSPLVGVNGVVYAAGMGTELYAIKHDTGLAESSWPMFRANPQHTGRVGGSR